MLKKTLTILAMTLSVSSYAQMADICFQLQEKNGKWMQPVIQRSAVVDGKDLFNKTRNPFYSKYRRYMTITWIDGSKKLVVIPKSNRSLLPLYYKKYQYDDRIYRIRALSENRTCPMS